MTILNPYTGKFEEVNKPPLKAWYIFAHLIKDTHFLNIERFVIHQYAFDQNNSKLYLMNHFLNKQQMTIREVSKFYQMLVEYGYDLCRKKVKSEN